ncbi:MAG: hypothetical protein HUJ27_00355 [Rhodobacteraceae bacterium]|nr:hypothetical protein [Paracoccaceae bacterium]
MTFGRREDRISIFGAFRPSLGQTVSRAVVTTYSLDLTAMLGFVLALGSDTETEFEASPLGLVKAFDRMRGKLLVLHQLSRVVAPGAHRSVLPLLDTMVHAVASNERRESWHPKTALVRYVSDAGVEWRFWIGSRNLTGSTDLDAGLTLVTSKAKSARRVPDIYGLANDLLSDAHLSTTELAELRSARWLAPPGVTVQSILWRRHGQRRRFIDPPLLARAERGCAISPFIDRRGLSEVVKAGARHLSLLTTASAGKTCAPFDGVQFRVDTAPEPAAQVSVEQQQEAEAGEFHDTPSTGIHAKLLALSKGGRTKLMLGSANLTGRGLNGPNAEAVAILDVDNPALANSLYAFVGGGIDLATVDLDDTAEKEKERAEQELDDLISQFLECRYSLSYRNDGLHLLIGDKGNKVLQLARFEVSPFLDPNSWTTLQTCVPSLLLLSKASPTSEQTSLVNFRASSLGSPEVSRTWIQTLEIDGVDFERRDRALLARYVGANRFRDWLRSLLDGVDGTGGQRWSDENVQRHQRNPSGQSVQIFTLETMLAAWARDPNGFETRVERMMVMLDSFVEVFEAIPDDEERMAALADVEEVRPFLQAVHDAIGVAS